MASIRGEKQRWHCLNCVVPQARAEEVSGHCFEIGSCGLQTEEAGEEVCLNAYFGAEHDSRQIRREVEAKLRGLGIESEVRIDWVEEEDWEAGWRRFFKPVRVSPRLVVHPSWIPVAAEPEQIAIVIDPQMAFGTGRHESTRLCLRALEEYLRPGDRCLDLGTGSGVLAIAAVRLGAGAVLGVDVDPRAVENARENLAANEVGQTQVEVCQGSIEQIGEQVFDLVLANIQSSALRPLLGPVFRVLEKGGVVLFSGLLSREELAFCAWVEDAGMRVEKVLAENEWICVVARRPE